MVFPKHFPQDCPPTTASEVRGELFRFVGNKPPGAKDFVSYFLLGKAFAQSKTCQACGLSVYISEEEVRFARGVTPAFRKLFVAKARVAPDWGKIEKTGDAHHTWWVTEGKNPEKIFDVVDMK